MKKLILLMLTGLILISFAFKKTAHKNAAIQENWSEWTADDCFKGIEYRSRRGSYNTYAQKWNWYVQIRNNYNNKINISYIITEPGEKKLPNHRTPIDANSTNGSLIAMLTSSEKCHVRVGYIRFGDDDTGPYYGCDL